MGQQFYIPRTLDDPPMFFLWNFDEAIIVIVMGILSALLGQLVVGLFLGFLLAKAFARMKAQGGRGLLIKALYWLTPSGWLIRTRTPSHVREYLGG